MRFIKKQLVWWRVLLIVGVAVIAIPIAAHVSSNPTTSIADRNVKIETAGVAGSNTVEAVHRNAVTIAARVRGLPQDYRNRRRQYWEQRVDRRLEQRQQYIDEQAGGGDDEDSADDDQPTKNSQAADDEEDDEDDAGDQGEDIVEQRREYVRRRADRGW